MPCTMCAHAAEGLGRRRDAHSQAGVIEGIGAPTDPRRTGGDNRAHASKGKLNVKPETKIHASVGRKFLGS